MRKNDCMVFQFRKLSTGDMGEILACSFWDVLYQCFLDEDFGAGTYEISNITTGSYGIYSIDEKGSRKRKGSFLS